MNDFLIVFKYIIDTNLLIAPKLVFLYLDIFLYIFINADGRRNNGCLYGEAHGAQDIDAYIKCRMYEIILYLP